MFKFTVKSVKYEDTFRRNVFLFPSNNKQFLIMINILMPKQPSGAFTVEYLNIFQLLGTIIEFHNIVIFSKNVMLLKLFECNWRIVHSFYLKSKFLYWIAHRLKLLFVKNGEVCEVNEKSSVGYRGCAKFLGKHE